MCLYYKIPYPDFRLKSDNVKKAVIQITNNGIGGKQNENRTQYAKHSCRQGETDDRRVRSNREKGKILYLILFYI